MCFHHDSLIGNPISRWYYNNTAALMTWRQRLSLSLSRYVPVAACVCRSPAERDIALRLWLIAFLQREHERKPFIRLCEFAEALNVWDLVLFLALPLSWHRLMSGVVQCTEDQSQLAGNVLTTLRQPCQNVHQSTNALLVTLTQCAFKVIWSLTLSQPLISFLSYPYFHCYTAKGALLHIFWNSTEFLDPKPDEEEAEISVRSTVYIRKLTQSSNNELSDLCPGILCFHMFPVFPCPYWVFPVHYEFVRPQPCFPYLVFPSVYKSCDSCLWVRS